MMLFVLAASTWYELPTLGLQTLSCYALFDLYECKLFCSSHAVGCSVKSGLALRPSSNRITRGICIVIALNHMHDACSSKRNPYRRQVLHLDISTRGTIMRIAPQCDGRL